MTGAALIPPSLKLTVKSHRHQMAELVAAELRKVPGAVVVIEPEGDEYGERRVTLRATAAGVTFKTDFDGDLPDFIMGHWFFETASRDDDRRLSPRFASMIGGTVNDCHWRKATGPTMGRESDGFRGEVRGFTPARLEAFAVIVWRALLDIAEGGCFQPAQVERAYP